MVPKSERGCISIKELSKAFLCSESVIARRVLDNDKINKNIYNQVVDDAIEAYNQLKQEKGTGENFYSVARM